MSATEYQEDLHAELGYRTAGRREIAQREWFSLRGEAGEAAPTPKAFEKLVNVLRATKWQKENPDRFRSNQRRYNLKPRRRARLNELQTERRHTRLRVRATVFACLECKAGWCRVPGTFRGGELPKFCTSACKERHRYRRNNPAARERAQHCRACGSAGHNARRHA